MLVKSNAVDIIVIDSVAALVPRAEVEGEIGDSHVGMQARLDEPGAAHPQRRRSRKTKTCMIFINQIRQKIGVMFGNPETTSGGLALKFYSSVRLDVRKISAIKDGEETIGSRVQGQGGQEQGGAVPAGDVHRLHVPPDQGMPTCSSFARFHPHRAVCHWGLTLLGLLAH